MNTTASFMEAATSFEASQVQRLPDASEAAWDRWVFEVCGTGFISFRAASQKSAPPPSPEQQLRACLADE